MSTAKVVLHCGLIAFSTLAGAATVGMETPEEINAALGFGLANSNSVPRVQLLEAQLSDFSTSLPAAYIEATINGLDWELDLSPRIGSRKAFILIEIRPDRSSWSGYEYRTAWLFPYGGTPQGNGLGTGELSSPDRCTTLGCFTDNSGRVTLRFSSLFTNQSWVQCTLVAAFYEMD